MRGSSPSAANAVHKVLGHLGHIEVDDVRHVGHIDAAGSHVGSHQHAVMPLGEAAQRRIPLGLRAVAVNLRRRPAGAGKPPRHAIRSVLGAHKDQKAARLGLQQVLQKLLLLVRFHFKGAKLHVFRRLEH